MKRFGGRTKREVLEWVFWPLLITASFIAALVAVGLVGRQLAASFSAWGISETTLGLIISTIIYGVTLGLLFAIARGLGRSLSWQESGLGRLLSWKDIALAMLAFVAYAIIGTLIISLLSALFPGLPFTAPQDIGFTQVFGTERALAFFVLVGVAPFVEEIIFRGILYGKLRASRMPAWGAAVVTSLLFAIAHGQLSVGVDVFVLSLAACLLREHTGSIWAGIVLHMIKNGVAFYMLFVVGMAAGA